jgi:ABC-type glutathione transport system ATPase component
MNNSILSIQNLCVNYITPGNPVKAVNDVSFEIQKGEIFGLVGESGSGKSTVVQAVLRTLPPPAVITGGKVLINNKDILSLSNTDVLQYRWKQISIVMQSALNALNPVLTIREQIKDVLEIHSDLTGKAVDNRIHELFSLIDIDVSRLDSYPHELSGGMRQRAVIAIALALMPPLIIMDEPTTALDVIVEREILAKIIELRKELGFTILFITHDLNLLLEFSDRLAIMRHGKVIELGQTQKIRSGGEHSYTQKLIGALPSASGPRKKGLLSKPKNRDFGSKPLLEVQKLSKNFPVSGFFRPKLIEAVKEISFQVFPGEIVALVGESGSGKSTIAKLITRLIRPTSGDIFLNGSNKKVSEARRVPLEYRKQVQMVFQDPFGSLNAVHTVFHHLARPLLRHQLVPKDELFNYIIEMLENVGLSPGAIFAEKFPHEMSGGERQRVALARALSLEPDLIVADEPTSMLDVSIRMEILEVLAKMRVKKNLSIIFITHDLASARYLADRIIVLQHGSIIEQGLAEDLIQSPQKTYTKQLVKAASPGWFESLSFNQKKGLDNA